MHLCAMNAMFIVHYVAMNISDQSARDDASTIRQIRNYIQHYVEHHTAS